MFALSKRKVLILSLTAALVTLALKFWAYAITGSVAILSDAAESLINFTAALIALIAVEFASRPADATHTYGHEKAEYFSSGVEGTLILAAAAGISYEAWHRLWNPMPLGEIPEGLAIALVAAAINFGVVRALLHAAEHHGSITLEAHAKHLLTDVWTTIGVVAALAASTLTNLYWIDPIIAFGVALHIVISGIDLLKRSFSGLMDHALPAEELKTIEGVLRKHASLNTTYHLLRTRRAGKTRFIDFHLLVHGDRSVQETHNLCEKIERLIKDSLDGEANITIHVEPLEDPASWDDKTS